MPACDVPEYTLPEERTASLRLPHVSENELTRHYTALCKRIHGVNDGFYPLGSCTMKYNPKIDEDMAALPGFTQLHPLQPVETAQGALEALHVLGSELGEIFGMDAVTFQPAAGAHGEFTGVLLIKAYHTDRGDTARTKIIVPDSAHGTNPATAAMCGYQVVNIPSGADGCVDLDALRAAVGPDTAGLMLTNPNTVGIFDKNILEITKIVHDAGGLCYYDGANLNAVMGVVRPGDMGFDCIHSNLHKTFATPHGGGGPGAGAVGCKDFLRKFLPGQRLSLDERCGLPFIEPDKAAAVFDTEHFTEIGKPCCRPCDYRFQKRYFLLVPCVLVGYLPAVLLLHFPYLPAVVCLHGLYSVLQGFDGFLVVGYLPMQGGVLPF